MLDQVGKPLQIDNSPLPDTELKPLIAFKKIVCDRTEIPNGPMGLTSPLFAPTPLLIYTLLSSRPNGHEDRS